MPNQAFVRFGVVVVLAVLSASPPGPATRFLNPSFPPDIPEQPRLLSIHVWGDEVVALGRIPYRVDLQSNSLEPLLIRSCSRVTSLAESASLQFVGCNSEGGSSVLAREKTQDAGWRTILTLPELSERNSSFQVATSGSAVAVARGDRIWTRAGSEAWRVIEIDTRKEHLGVASPDHALLTSRFLYLGWNRGEFGGALYRWPVLDDSETPLGPAELVREMHVNSIVEGARGEVWASAGLGHLGCRMGALLRVEGAEVRTILNERCRGDEEAVAGSPPPELRLPGRTVVNGFTLDEDGKGLLLAESLGVLRLDGGELTYAVPAELAQRYSPHERLHVHVSPTGIVSTPDGIFVSTSGLGVFAFLGDERELRQLVLKGASD